MSSSLATKKGNLFDYEHLEVIHRLPIQQAESEITTLFNRSVRNFIKIGQKLREVHHRFPTVELFTAWFEAKFDGSQRTAYNLMKLAERFSDVSDEAIANIGLSTLYELAAASVPDSARQAALQLASEGHQVTTEMAGAIIEQARQEEETAQGSLFASPDSSNPVYNEIPLCLCGHRADRHPNGDCDDCVCEQFDEAEAGQDDVSIHKRITDEPSPETQYLLGPDCLCGHSPANHPGASACNACTCECYETERVNRANVETLAEVTETTTTKTKTVVEAAPDPIAQMKGEADILFDAATINLAITIFPKKGDDRDCMVWLKSGEVSVQSMCKHSQIQDALATFTLAQQMLALKIQLWENAEAKKKANTTPVTTAKASTKTTTKTSTTKKGKK